VGSQLIIGGKRSTWIALTVGLVTLLTAGVPVMLRVLNVESRDDAVAAREAMKTELRGENENMDLRLRKIEGDVAAVETHVIWIRAALQDAGYRAPKAKP
jgi:hypothetical protein